MIFVGSSPTEGTIKRLIMITWKLINDDLGNVFEVTEIHWPNPNYFTRVVTQLA